MFYLSVFMGYVAVEMKRLVCKNNSGTLQRGGVIDMDVKRTIIFRQIGAKIAYYRTLRHCNSLRLLDPCRFLQYNH